MHVSSTDYMYMNKETYKEKMVPASEPKQNWWMTITKGPTGRSCSQTKIIDEPKIIAKLSSRSLDTTRGHERPRETTGDHERPREATGGRGRPQRLVPAHRFWRRQGI